MSINSASELHPTAQRVASAGVALGLDMRIVTFEQSTRTAADAAAARWARL